MRSVLYFAVYQVKRIFTSPKPYLLLLALYGVLRVGVNGASEYLSEQGERFQAVELFVFCSGSLFFQLILILGLLFLVGDAPFLTEGLSFRLMRTTRRRWLAGEILACVFTAAIYLIAVEALFLLIFWGQTSFQNEWSDSVILAAQVNTGGSILNMKMAINFSMRVIKAGSPYAMFGLTFLYDLLLYTFLSYVLVVFNLKFTAAYGIFVVMIVEGIKLIQYYVLPYKALWYCSPCSVVCLGEQAISSWTILYPVFFLLVLIWIMAVLALQQVESSELSRRGPL